jgi:hypothetical protein
MRAGFPLASLVLLVTVLASLLACADVDRWREQYSWLADDWPWRLVALFGGAGLMGGLIGCAYLFVGGVSWRTRLLAPIAGIVAAQIGVLILVAPGSIWTTIFAVGVLLACTVIVRLGAE